jgi:hypothetical protein
MLSHGNVHLQEGKNPHGGDRRWVTKDVYLSHNKRTTLALHLASSCPIRMTYLEKPPPPTYNYHTKTFMADLQMMQPHGTIWDL